MSERARYLIVLLTATWVTLAGCENGPISREWTEEVPVDGERNVVVERRVEFTQSETLAGDVRSLQMHQSSLAIRLRRGPTLAWLGLVVPMLLYRDSAADEWVMVATTPECHVWHNNGKPVPPYWEFRLRNDMWVEVPLSPESIGRPANLFVAYDKPLPAQHLSVPQKNQIQRAYSLAPRFRSVYAEEKSYC